MPSASLALFGALVLAWIAIEAIATPVDRPSAGTLALATGLLVLAGHVAGVIEHVATARSWNGALPVGGALAAAGIALRAWAIVSLGDGFVSALAARRIARVTTGAYRIMRHPSEVGLALCSLGLALVLASYAALAAAAIAIPFATVRCRREDACLARDEV